MRVRPLLAPGLAVLLWWSCVPAVAGPSSRCRVGVQVHLQPGGAPEPNSIRHLRAFVERGIADYVLLVCQGLNDTERDNAIRYLVQHDVRFLLQDAWAGDKRRYSPQDIARVRSIAGDRFLGVHTGELDSSGMPPETYAPKSSGSPPTRRAMHEAYVKRVKALADGYRTTHQAPVAHSSALLWHAKFAEAGVEVLCSEIGENAPNASMMIASNRGAARAYGRPWIIDHSTWWQPRGNAGELVSPREGHTPWCLFTSLLGAVMGGADCVQLEVDWAAYDRDTLFTGSGSTGDLLPWGVAMRTLFALSGAIGERGDVVTPFAVLVDSASGWPGVGWRTGDVRGTGLYDGIRHRFMQTRDADLSLKVLDAFYPGFERCGWDPEYPGFLSESPFGQLDMAPANLPASRYARYRVLVALGCHRSTPETRAALREYVASGGTLVCADTLFLDERERPLPGSAAEPLIGCVPDTRPGALRRLYQPSTAIDDVPGILKSATRDEWQTQWLHPVRLTTGRAVARMNGEPYIVENRIGSGRVYYVTGANMVGSDAVHRGQEPFLYANGLSAFLNGLNERFGDGVGLSPWTGLEHILDERADGSAMLLVMNHGDMAVRRDASLRRERPTGSARLVAQGTWEGWKPGAAVALKVDGGVVRWSFEMQPKSFALFEFTK